MRSLFAVLAMPALLCAQATPAARNAAAAPSPAVATRPAPEKHAPGTPADDAVPLRPGTHRLAAYATIDGATLRLPYVLYLPEDFTPQSKLPVVVFLHGGGECGTDLDAIFLHGIPRELQRAERPHLRKNFPMIVVAPQCPPRGERWTDSRMPRYVHALLDSLLARLPHDSDRVSCTGLSMGGDGTWRAAFERPERFAAIAPISARAHRLEDVRALKDVHVLAYCGTDDGDRVSGSHAMAAALRRVGGDATTVEIPGGHAVWEPVYQDPRFYDWLISRRKSVPGAAAPTFADAAPLKPGFHKRSIFIELAGQKFDLACSVYIPAGYRPGAKLPTLLFLADDLQTGIERDGMVHYGPAAEVVRGELRDFGFVTLCPQLLPAITRWDNPAVLEALAKAVASAETTLPIDGKRLYVAGANLGARGATMLSQRSPGKYNSAIALLTHPRTALNDLRGEWIKSQRVMVVATTPFDEGRVQQITAFLEGAAPGSNYTVFSSQPGAQRPFASDKLYQWLLQQR
jgi:predicted peptidase